MMRIKHSYFENCGKHKGVIQTEEEFKRLQRLHPFYTYLKVIDQDETGLVFECTNLDKETKKCKIHKKRPGICRRYPQEELYRQPAKVWEARNFLPQPQTPRHPK